MNLSVFGLMLALLTPETALEERQSAGSLLEGVEVVTVYHRFGYDEADQPFRIRGPIVLERARLTEFLQGITTDESTLVEVCPLKPLQNGVYGFYVGKEERARMCRIVTGSPKEE